MRADGSGAAIPIALPDTNQVDEITYSNEGKWIVYRIGVVAGMRRLYRYRIGDSTAPASDPGRFDQ